MYCSRLALQVISPADTILKAVLHVEGLPPAPPPPPPPFPLQAVWADLLQTLDCKIHSRSVLHTSMSFQVSMAVSRAIHPPTRHIVSSINAFTTARWRVRKDVILTLWKRDLSPAFAILRRWLILKRVLVCSLREGILKCWIHQSLEQVPSLTPQETLRGF